MKTEQTLSICDPQWAEALAVFTQAADLLGMVSRKSLWGQFWSSHQRFFKYLCIASKVRCLVELAKKELEAGKVSFSTLLKWLIIFRLFLFCFKKDKWQYKAVILRIVFCPPVCCDWFTIHGWSSDPRSSWWKRGTPRQICFCCRVSITVLSVCVG